MEQSIINNIKSLGIDMINEAKSGHPGIVLGAAPIIYTLYANHLNINPNDPKWINRDRFVMSAGHGSALLYATLFMAGYLEINDIKNFRKLHSKTPGHPEFNTTLGVDISTGLLGQGFASAVGMAIAEAKLQQESNGIINHKIYVLCSDGDLMEGISSEAASIAGTLKLNNLIVLYDSNNVSADGNTSLTFNENICSKFESMGWDSIYVKDGNNVKLIDRAIDKAKRNTKPTIIEIKTILGQDSMYANTNEVHGKVLEIKDIDLIKQKLNVAKNPFYVNDNARASFQKMIFDRNTIYYSKWSESYQKYSNLSKDDTKKFNFYFEKQNINIDNINFEVYEDIKEDLRKSNSTVLNKVAAYVPSLIGGSADLSHSTGTYLEKYDNIVPENYSGRNIMFGVREGAMAAILNGLALYNYRPFGSTFLAFSDYLKPGIRMSALMNLPVIYIFTHDSINIGEDGPTHQPIEQLSCLRTIQNFDVYRPCDMKELIGSYKCALKNNKPCAIILSRNETPLLKGSKDNIEKGAYVVQDNEKFTGILIATGTDVATAIYVANSLEKEYQIKLRVVSMPCKELFERQEVSYQEEILPKGYKKVVIEAGISLGWEGYVYSKKYLCTLDRFGASGSKDEVLKECNFDFESIRSKILSVMK